jgi:hypothetical protein
MTLHTEPWDRDVRTRSAVSRNVDLGRRYIIVCVVSLVAGRSGGSEIMIVNAIIRWGAWYYSIVLNACRVTSMADKHTIFTRISCTLFTCDMYMCHLRHINDPVLSSLKMEGILLIIRNVMPWSFMYSLVVISCLSAFPVENTVSYFYSFVISDSWLSHVFLLTLKLFGDNTKLKFQYPGFSISTCDFYFSSKYYPYSL